MNQGRELDAAAQRRHAQTVALTLRAEYATLERVVNPNLGRCG